MTLKQQLIERIKMAKRQENIYALLPFDFDHLVELLESCKDLELSERGTWQYYDENGNGKTLNPKE